MKSDFKTKGSEHFSVNVNNQFKMPARGRGRETLGDVFQKSEYF